MDLISMIFGALLAVGGSFLAQRNLLIINKKSNDQKLALEVVLLLHEFNSHVETLAKLPTDSAILESKLEVSKEEGAIISILHRLTFMAFKFESKDNIDLSFELSKFCLEECNQNEDNAYKLIGRCHKLINPGLVAKLDSEFG